MSYMEMLTYMRPDGTEYIVTPTEDGKYRYTVRNDKGRRLSGEVRLPYKTGLQFSIFAALSWTREYVRSLEATHAD